MDSAATVESHVESHVGHGSPDITGQHELHDELNDSELNQTTTANGHTNHLDDLNENSLPRDEKPEETTNLCGSPLRLEIEKNKKYETIRMKDYMRRAVKATSQYNKMINQERKDERRICLDLQTYTLHYPLGLGAENRMLKRNVETGRCKEKGKYPIAVLPGHYQDHYRQYTSQELKYFPLNTCIYGPVITDTDKLPPILTRIEEDSFSESDSDSTTSTEHSCCCDENRCKKLKLANGCAMDRECDCMVSGPDDDESEAPSSPAASENEADADDEQPPKLINLSAHFQHRENAFCELCKKKELTKVDGTNERLIHCTDCNLSYHPICLEMTPEMVSEVQLYPWQCSNCKACNVSIRLGGFK